LRPHAIDYRYALPRALSTKADRHPHGSRREFWINLQKDYDLRAARREHAKKIARVRPLAKAA
jgi:hypothetical protein